MEHATVKDWVSNTQSICQNFQVGIDWLQATGNVSALDELFRLLQSHGDEYVCYADSPFTSGRRYESHAKSTRGAILAWNIHPAGYYEYWISFPGSALALFDAFDTKLLIASLIQLDARFTRLDVKLDDFTKSLSPSDICSACEVGNYSGFNIYDPRFPKRSGQYQGFTIYFGSANSEKRVRFYDKSFESQGEIDAYRLEFQARRSSADTIAKFVHQLDIAGDDFLELYSDLLKNLVVGSIDFVDRVQVDGSRLRTDRCARLGFWQEFLDRLAVAGIRISPIRPKPSLAKAVKWVERQVIPTLAMIREALPPKHFDRFVRASLRKGVDRLTSAKQKLIEVSKRDAHSIRLIRDYCNT